MKRNYWKMFVVTLIASTLTGEKTTIIERVQDFASNNHSYDAQPIFYSSNFELIFYSFISIASILGILYTIFIGNVIVVGKNGYFIKNHDENSELSEIFSGFKGNYFNVVIGIGGGKTIDVAKMIAKTVSAFNGASVIKYSSFDIIFPSFRYN